MADRYAVGIGAGKTWTNADTSLWSASSGGASGASVPGAGDVAIFDANSGGTGAYAVSLNYDPTLSGITLAGISSATPLLIRSSVRGTQRTITAGTVTGGGDTDFQDIVGAGAGSWDLSAVTSGDAGNNSGITFSPAQTNYWIGGTGSWSDAAHWSTSTGGAADGRVPLPQDSAVVDANSGTGTITQDMPRIGATDFTGSSGITWSPSTGTSFFGSINLTNLGTLGAGVNTWVYEGRGSSTLTSAGLVWLRGIEVDCISGTLTLGDAFSSSATAAIGLKLTSGTFSANGFNVTLARDFTASGSVTRVLNMGSGTWTITFNGTLWTASGSNLTINASTSTINYTGTMTAARTFAGGGYTYNNFTNASAGAFALQFTGSNTFNTFHVDASAAARTVLFTAGTTTTLANFTRDAGSNAVTIGSITAATHTLSKSGGGVVSLHDMAISYSVATQTDTFYAGATPPSSDDGNNTNWIFTAPPSTGGNANTMIRAGGVVPS